jgi:diguanylate cyclase (GGDEF)-like protein
MRYGGEEFLIAVPGASMSDARAIMERIRRQVETLRLQYGAYELSFTFSGGIASFPAPGVNDVEGIIQRADAALYKAKENGRNQLVIAG